MPQDALATSIDRLRGELRRAVRGRLAWTLVAWVTAWAWIALALDRWLEPPAPLRLAVIAVSVAAVAVWLALVAWPLWRRRYSDREIARLLARHTPGAADAILTSLDAAEREPDPASSPLAAATRARANAQLASADTPRVFRRLTESGRFGFAVIALAGAVGFVATQPDKAAVFARRLALSPEPWPRTVRLVPEGFRHDAGADEWFRHVARGDDVEVVVWADLSGGGRAPSEVWSRTRRGDRSRRVAALVRVGGPATRGDGAAAQEFRLRLEAITEPTTVAIAGGDGRLRLRIEPVAAPAVASARLAITPPDYLCVAAYEVEAASAEAVPFGSDVALIVEATKPIAELVANVTSAGDEAGAVAIGADSPADGDAAAPNRVTIPLGPVRAPTTVSVALRDTDGVESKEPFLASLEVTPDSPPSATLIRSGFGRGVTRDARLPLRAAADDDYGVASARLVVQRDEAELFAQPITVADLDAEGEAEVDLLALRSAGTSVEVGDRLALRLIVTDAYDLGPPHVASSEAIEVEVVTPDALLARLAEAELALGGVLEGIVSDARRLAYALDRVARGATEPPQASAAVDFLLDARKVRRGAAGLAERFSALRDEVINNRLDQPAMTERLRGDVIAPLQSVVSEDIASLIRRLEAPPQGEPQRAAALAQRAAERLQRILDRLGARQSYNEVVALLRGLIQEQRRINSETDRERRERARRLLLE